MPSAPPPTTAEVDAIAGMRDAVRRNLEITAAYGRLSAAFATRQPGGANWCTFATWASRQAGQTIRKEDLGRAVTARLRQRVAGLPLPGELHDRLGLTPARLEAVIADATAGLPGLDRAAGAVARGNLKVFGEIGRVFADVLATPPAGDADVTAVAAGLRPGPPPGGQAELARAFQHYGAARRPTPAGDELMFLANVRIGLHEQTRLQPEIQEAMDAAVLDVAATTARVLAALDRAMPLGRPVRTGIARQAARRLAAHLARELAAVVRVGVTDHLMTLALPGGARHLGRDVPGTYPPPLARRTTPE
ncbi:MAG: hypothetical protein AB7O28_20660, partial [Vicinamibacterales bacterium]